MERHNLYRHYIRHARHIAFLPKIIVLSLFVILPIFAFFLGMSVQKYQEISLKRKISEFSAMPFTQGKSYIDKQSSKNKCYPIVSEGKIIRTTCLE